MTEEKICALPIIDGMASFMTGNVEVQVKERIVRCCDCERWNEEPPNYREEPQWCGQFSHHAEPDGFCKWGASRR